MLLWGEKQKWLIKLLKHSWNRWSCARNFQTVFKPDDPRWGLTINHQLNTMKRIIKLMVYNKKCVMRRLIVEAHKCSHNEVPDRKLWHPFSTHVWDSYRKKRRLKNKKVITMELKGFRAGSDPECRLTRRSKSKNFIKQKADVVAGNKNQKPKNTGEVRPKQWTDAEVVAKSWLNTTRLKS